MEKIEKGGTLGEAKKWVSIAMWCLLIIIAMAGWGSYWFKKPVINYQKETLANKTELLEQTFKGYKKLGGVQLHIMWHKKFGRAKYVLQSKEQLNEYNCSNALYRFFRDLGSYVVLENAENMGKRLKINSKKRSSIKKVKAGDIIVFKKSKKSGVGHVGIVEGLSYSKNKRVIYMDMDVKFSGVGYRHIDFWDKRVEGIYPVTLTFWAGNLFKE